MAALSVTQPSHVMFDQGLISSHVGIHIGNGIYILFSDGVPTGGDGWTGPGTLVIDYTNSDIYMNTGTKASPTWTKKVD